MKEPTNASPKTSRRFGAFPSLGVALALAACGGGDDGAERSPAAADSPDLAGRVFLAQRPADETPVAEVLAAPKGGETVAVTGRIGGVVEPFGKGYAVFFLADESLVFCDEMSEPDHCPTPWDACCEDPDKIRANRLLVRFADDSGDVLPFGLKGLGGLAPNDRVVVRGKAVEADAGGGTVIEAEGLWRIGKTSGQAG